ncbi:hypothetical protein Tco_0283137, partial [Tanacetum coccineum]
MLNLDVGSHLLHNGLPAGNPYVTTSVLDCKPQHKIKDLLTVNAQHKIDVTSLALLIHEHLMEVMLHLEREKGTSEENSQDCIMMPIWKDFSYFDSPTKNVENGKPKTADDAQKHVEDGLNHENAKQERFLDDSSSKDVNVVGQQVNTANLDVNTGSLELNIVGPSTSTARSNEEDNTEEEPKVDLGNITNSYIVPNTPNTRIHKDYPIDNVIGEVQSTVQTRRMLKPTSEQGFLSDIEPTIIAKALSDSSWVEAMKEELLQFKLQQVYVDDIIFGSTNKELLQQKEMEYLIKSDKYVAKDFVRNHYSDVKSASLLKHKQSSQFGKQLISGSVKSQTVVATSTAEAEMWLLQVAMDKKLILASKCYAVKRTMGTRSCNDTNSFNHLRHCLRGRFLISLQQHAWIKGCVISKVGDEAVHKELGDRMERAATTASSLEAEQDSGSGPRCQDTILGGVNAQTSPKFAEMHNVVAFLEKPEESDGFAEIIDFLKASSVHYALTVNPIIYTSCIVQFWATTKVQTVNEVRQLQALVDKKRVIVTKSSIRRDLHLDDAEGTDCLPTTTIFEALARIGRITPLFDTMMVQAYEEVGEDSYHPTDSTQIPIIDQPSSSSQPKKKQPSKKAQRQEAEVPQDKTEHEESVPTSSNDPQSSGEDSMQLTDLMVLCTKLQTQVLDLEKAKDAQAKKIAALKKRIQRLERKKMPRPTSLKRLKKVGMSMESSKDQEILGDPEDASKQGRGIADLDKEDDVTLV